MSNPNDVDDQSLADIEAHLDIDSIFREKHDGTATAMLSTGTETTHTQGSSTFGTNDDASFIDCNSEVFVDSNNNNDDNDRGDEGDDRKPPATSNHNNLFIDGRGFGLANNGINPNAATTAASFPQASQEAGHTTNVAYGPNPNAASLQFPAFASNIGVCPYCGAVSSNNRWTMQQTAPQASTAHQSTTEVPSNLPAWIVPSDQVTAADILPDRGTGPRSHPANRDMLREVSNKFNDYNSVGGDTKSIVLEIKDNIEGENNGRFLKRIKKIGDKTWYAVMDDTEIIAKIRKIFHTMKSTKKKKREKSAGTKNAVWLKPPPPPSPH